MHGDMVRFIAFDFILGLVLTGVMRVALVHFRADAVTSGSLFTAARNVASSSVV